MTGKPFTRPAHYVAAGTVGLVLCALLVLVIERVLEAPNASSLYYKQSRWAAGTAFLFLLSLALLARGISLGIGRRRASPGGREVERVP